MRRNRVKFPLNLDVVLVRVERADLARDADLGSYKDAAPGRSQDGPEDRQRGADRGEVDFETGQPGCCRVSPGWVELEGAYGEVLDHVDYTEGSVEDGSREGLDHDGQERGKQGRHIKTRGLTGRLGRAGSSSGCHT